MYRLPIWLLPVAVLGACGAPPPETMTGQQRADAALRSACREHADAVYDRNNRDQIYRIGTRDTPYSGQYNAASIDAGLSQRYAHQNLIRDCIRNTGTETDRTEPGPNATPQP